MKFTKKNIFIICLLWVFGLVGGYFFGVGSAILPEENVAYNYYFSKNFEQNTNVETVIASDFIQTDCLKTKKENTTSFFMLKSESLLKISKRILLDLLQPSAAITPACESNPEAKKI